MLVAIIKVHEILDLTFPLEGRMSLPSAVPLTASSANRPERATMT